MTIDGFSVANLGLFQPVTPGEVALQAEQKAKENAEVVIKDVEELDKVDPDGKQEKDHPQQKKQTKDDEEAVQEDEAAAKVVLDKDIDLKRFKVKFNNDTNLVELYDMDTGTVVETIKPKDLVDLMSKSKNPSGILVDREI